MNAIEENTPKFTHENIDDLISAVISGCEADNLVQGTQQNPLASLYSQTVHDKDKLIANNRTTSTGYFFSRLIAEFTNVISCQKLNLCKLAFKVTDSKISTWIVINDDDEKTEHMIYMIEAAMNAEFEQYGIAQITTIVEVSDDFPVPTGYHELTSLNTTQ